MTMWLLDVGKWFMTFLLGCYVVRWICEKFQPQQQQQQEQQPHREQQAKEKTEKPLLNDVKANFNKDKSQSNATKTMLDNRPDQHNDIANDHQSVAVKPQSKQNENHLLERKKTALNEQQNQSPKINKMGNIYGKTDKVCWMVH